jgi:serine/threonine-protein kinase HipA
MTKRRAQTRALAVWMNGEKVGEWRGGATPRTEFIYDDSWWTSGKARPLSLSLPRLPGNVAHRGEHVTAWFENLLPDSPTIRDRLRTRFRTATTEAIDLLEAIGRDCVGAVQLLPADAPPPSSQRIEADPLSETAVATTLRNVTSGTPLGANAAHAAPFRISIAGAQEKTALLRHGNRWCEPRGTTPTTHIFKLPLGLIGNIRANMKDSVENEWLCLQLLSRWGLPAANAELAHFRDDVSDESVLIVERFDRAWAARQDDSPWIVRLPQEDLCQAFGRSRDDKYEADGGPGIQEILELLARGANSTNDIRLFVLAQLAGWLLAAPDGHAKNYSIFLNANGYTLTPLYDVLSAWPIIGPGPNELAEQDVEVAMGVRRTKNLERKLRHISTSHWKALATRTGVPGMFEEMEHLVHRADSAFDHIATTLPADFPESVWHRIRQGVRAQCEKFRIGATALSNV